jgi:hypothetical protein
MSIGGNTRGTNPECAGPLADGPGGHNLIGNTGTGTGTGACSGLANGVNGDPAIGTGNATTCEQAPINDTDQRGHSRNATTRGGCDIGAYDTGGAP